jgi:hypothetical protein
MAQAAMGHLSYGELIVFDAFAAAPSDPFVDRMFRTYRPTVIATAILDRAAAGDATARSFILKMGSVGRYHEGLVNALMSTRDGTALRAVIDLFSSCLNQFPEQRLLDLLALAESLADPLQAIESLLTAVAGSPSIVHTRLHRELLVAAVRHLKAPRLDLLSQAGRLLALHPTETIGIMVAALPALPDPRTLALVRFAEDHRSAILANEKHVLL